MAGGADQRINCALQHNSYTKANYPQSNDGWARVRKVEVVAESPGQGALRREVLVTGILV